MSLVNFLVANPWQLVTSLLAGLACLLVYHIINFYRNRKNFPPGPTPLPFIGNILAFRQNGRHNHDIILDLGKKYGSLYTLYLGSDPQVIVTDPDLSLEVMKRHQFAGRPKLALIDEFFVEGSTDVIFSDFNKEWEVLRKVAHSALRKYAVSDALPKVVANVVDEVVDKMKTESSNGETIDMKKCLYRLMYAILATSAFGGRYQLDDPDLLKWIDATETQIELNSTFIILDFMPYLKIFYGNAMKRFRETVAIQREIEEKKYQEHLKSFDGKTIRDFTDALFMAKKEAEEENVLDAVKYLKPDNIMNTMSDMFSAGSDTTRTTLQWAFLFLTSYPHHQKRIRQEVEDNIPDEDIPTLAHRAKCHLTAAFIAETIRIRHIVPLNLPHKATVDTQLGDYMIRAGTTVLPMIRPALMDKKVWGDPDVFRPERFLVVYGKFITKPEIQYVPFSGGRRTCPGEKVALADMFFVIARFMQKTKGYEFALVDGPGSADLSGDPDISAVFVPHDYRLVLKAVS